MPLTVLSTGLPEVLVLIPKVFGDERGFFYESFNAHDFEAAVGARRVFVQDNDSYSVGGVMRGLHFQVERPQAKLVRVISGEVFDVVVDVRRSSPNFGKWVGVTLSAENKHQLWVPEGFAHGFLVTAKSAQVSYKVTEHWFPEFERSLLWNDPHICVRWPLSGTPLLAPKDARGSTLEEIDGFP